MSFFIIAETSGSMIKYLVDTCIWRDFYENRKNKAGKNISVPAQDFILHATKKGLLIFISQITIRELRVKYSEKELKDILTMLSILTKIKIIDFSNNEANEAEILSIQHNLPFADCLLAIQARSHNCIVVTRDKHFFNELKDICKSIKPEDAF